MSLDGAYNDIKARIQTAWPLIEPTVPLALLNDGFQLPEPPIPWLLVEVMWGSGAGITIGAPGSNRARRYGRIWLHGFVPIGTEQGRAMQIAGRAGKIFEDQDFGSVVCNAMEPGGAESNTDNGLYFGQSVDVPFWTDEDI